MAIVGQSSWFSSAPNDVSCEQDFYMFDFFKTVSSREHRQAWFIAIVADAIQIVGLPLFAAGGVSPVDTALDLAVAAILYRLLGWHWALLPTFAAELVPGLDLFPTWTAAVFFMTRKAVRTAEVEILEPGPAPAPRP
jgi:hypothetical protein